MNIIEFDNDIYLNFYGIESLNLPNGWEELHNALYLENSLSNVISGHFFLNSITQFYQSWFKARSLGLLNIHTFNQNLLEQLMNGFKLANSWTHFCGFFHIEHEQYGKRPSEYFLKFSNNSYALGDKAERVKLPVNERLKLVSNYTNHDKRETVFFPLSVNYQSSQDLIKQHLYFEKELLLNLADAYITNEINTNMKIQPTAIFKKGIKTDTSNLKSSITLKKEKTNSDISLTDATIISALTYALEMENKEKFKGDDILITKHLAELFPNQRYLAHDTLKKRWGPGRDELDISKKKKEK